MHPALTGNGTLVDLTFRALTTGHSNLALSNLVLADDTRPPGLIVASTIDGGVDVTDNAAPVAASDSYTTSQDIPLSVAAPGVLTNDDDPDDDSLTAVLDDGPISGALDLSPDGGFVYTPTQGFSGLDNFKYHAHDGLAASNFATVTLTVTTSQATDSFVFLPIILRSTSSTD